MKRMSHERAFVLHHYAFSESSLVLEVFTRNEGRVVLIAKGVKKPSSQFRPVLLPLQELTIAYSRPKAEQAEVGTLKSAEWQGGRTMPVGAALLSGYYVNELMLKLLAREDPHPALFDAYAQTLQWLRHDQLLQPSLRVFEMLLLKEIGLLPALNSTGGQLGPIAQESAYFLSMEGLRTGQDLPNQPNLAGAVWMQLQMALDEPTNAARIEHLQSSIQNLNTAQQTALKQQLRQLLALHIGGRGLKTRYLMSDARDLMRSL